MYLPFESNAGMLAACMDMLDELCATYLDIKQKSPAGSYFGRGALPAADKIYDCLDGQRDIAPLTGLGDDVERLLGRISLSDGLPLPRLLISLGADEFAALAVLLALAPLINRKYERVFAQLQQSSRETAATLGLAADLHALVLGDGARVACLMDAQTPINRFVLEGDAKGFGPGRPLRLRRAAALFLMGREDCLPEQLCGICRYEPAPKREDILAGAQEVAQAERFAAHFIEGDDRVGLMQLCAPEGTGKRFAARCAAAANGVGLLTVDCEVLSQLGADARAAAIESVASFSFLHDLLPLFTNFEFSALPSRAERTQAMRRVIEAVRCAVPVFAVCTREHVELPECDGVSPMHLSLRARTLGEQEAFWRYFLARGSLPYDPQGDIMDAAGVYSLTPGQIERVMVAAESDSISLGRGHIAGECIARAVKNLCRPRMMALTRPLELHFTWDDLELGPEQITLLRQLIDRVRYRYKVKEQWGFDRKLPYGRGISVLLYGPPGTGKTMAAQVLARELGLDAYRVDMSRVIDKYIGETEKKLGELFDAARDSNAILFFDEADALFSRRTEVSDARDKYANADTAYLLQRMEEHNGISILATNIALNFDEAFKRRISFMVSMPLPDAQQRRRIWRGVFPADAPLGSDVALDFFADRFELSGSSIKSIAVSAAFLAAAEGGKITRERITRALRDEYAKNGRVIMEHELY